MSEEKKLTALEETGRDYTRLCAQLGEFQYRIEVYKREIAGLIEELKKVNSKADFLQKQQQMHKEKIDGISEEKH